MLLALLLTLCSPISTYDADQSKGANDTALSCKQKLVVVVTVDSGDSLSSQDIDFSISCIGSPDGRCPCTCNYAADSSCSCRDLTSQLTVSLTKGPLWASYPLAYLQAFNYKPYEAIVRPGAGQCKDGAWETSPTCSWYYQAGQKVPDSQGFVCECDSSQIWDETFGSNTERTRANLDCDFFSDPLDILIGRKPCSAHCLMMDPHWYGGYGLGEASLQFEISASLTYSDSSSSSSNSNSSSSSEKLKLSPSLPWAVSTNRTLAAKLLGDLAGYTQLPVLSERVLMIPHPRSGQSLQHVFANRSEWMLVVRSKITFDGGECDKVGTSFTAFRYQTGGCKRAPQVCLTSQLKDLLLADKDRIASGRVPLYLVSQYSHGLDSELKAFTGGPLSFALPVTGIRSSLVQLEAEADSIRFVTNTSPGKILGARMCQFAETKCGGFEASAARGYLHAFLANQGTLAAAYTITVSNCSVNVRPVEAQRVALAPGQNGTIVPFQIYVEDDQAVEQRYCWLTMLDSQGSVSDRVVVTFYTNATTYEDWPSGGLVGNGTGAGTLSQTDCSTICHNPLDFVCAVKNSCWGKVGSFLGLLGGTLAAAGLLFLAFKFGWIGSLLSMCGGACGTLFSCCCGSNSNSSSKYDDSKQGRKAERERKGGRHGSRHNRQHSTFDELFEEEQQQRGSNGKGRSSSNYGHYRISGRESQSPDPYYEHRKASSFAGEGGKRSASGRKYSGSGSGAGARSPAAPWDESAAGGGYVPGGRLAGSSIRGKVARGPGRAKAYSRRGGGGESFDEGFESEFEGRRFEAGEFEVELDEGGPTQWEMPLPAARQPAASFSRPFSSSPGRAMVMSRDSPDRSPAQQRSRSASLLTELVGSARLAAAKRMGEFDDDEYDGDAYDGEFEGAKGQTSSSRLSGPGRSGWPSGPGDSASGYSYDKSSSARTKHQQQQPGLRQPGRAASVPGLSGLAAAAAASSAAKARGRDKHGSSSRGEEPSTFFLPDAQTVPNRGPAVLSSSRESMARSPSESLHYEQQQKEQLPASPRRDESARRSSSQPLRMLHASKDGPTDDGSEPEHYSGVHREGHWHQEQQQQPRHVGSSRQSSSRPGSSSITRRHSAGSSAKQGQRSPQQLLLQDLAWQQQEQQQQQQQQQQQSQRQQQAVSATRSPLPQRLSSSNGRQQQQQGAAHSRIPSCEDDFFAPNYDDEPLAGVEEGLDHDEHILPQGKYHSEERMWQRGPRMSSARQQQHGESPLMQQQQQQWQRPQQRQQLAAMSDPGGSTRRRVTPTGQQQVPLQAGQLSTAARPHLAPFTSSSHGGSPQQHHHQQQQQLQQQHGEAARRSGQQVPQAASPAVAPGLLRHHQPSLQHSAGDKLSRPGTARQTIGSSNPGGIGRHTQQQQQQGMSSEDSGPLPASPPPQQQSLISQSLRVPGFVRVAAAALSAPGGVARGHSSSPGGSRSPGQHGSTRRQTGSSRQDMLTSNPLYDARDG